MKDIKSHLLQKLLPNSSDQDRELWYRTNEQIQKVVEAMKGYCEITIQECINLLPWNLYADRDEYAKDIQGQLCKDMEEIKSQL